MTVGIFITREIGNRYSILFPRTEMSVKISALCIISYYFVTVFDFTKQSLYHIVIIIFVNIVVVVVCISRIPGCPWKH